MIYTDWKPSLGHIQYLLNFLRPAEPKADLDFINWEHAVGMPFPTFLNSLIGQQLIEKAPLADQLRVKSEDDLRKILHTFDLPIDGKKGELIARLLSNVDWHYLNLSIGYTHYVLTNRGRQILKTFFSNRQRFLQAVQSLPAHENGHPPPPAMQPLTQRYVLEKYRVLFLGIQPEKHKETPLPSLPPQPTPPPQPVAQPQPSFPAQPTPPPQPVARPQPSFPAQPTPPPQPVAQPQPSFPAQPTPPPQPVAQPQPSFPAQPTPSPQPVARPQPSFPPQPTPSPQQTFRQEPIPSQSFEMPQTSVIPSGPSADPFYHYDDTSPVPTQVLRKRVTRSSKPSSPGRPVQPSEQNRFAPWPYGGQEEDHVQAEPDDRPVESQRIPIQRTQRTFSQNGVERSRPEPAAPPPSLHIEWCRIQSGRFFMGADTDLDPHAHENESPAIELHLPTFYISKYPITNIIYQAFVNDVRPDRLPTGWKNGHYPFGKAFHPVNSVSFGDASRFCSWLSFQINQTVTLPTEAQWEKAARGTDGRLYPWGNNWSATYCNSKENRLNKTTPVNQYPHAASPYGVIDMLGNVWEWTRSAFKPYPYYPNDGRESPRPEDLMVVRGGSYQWSRFVCRASVRDWYVVGRYHLGFRVCVSSQPTKDLDGEAIATPESHTPPSNRHQP